MPLRRIRQDTDQLLNAVLFARSVTYPCMNLSMILRTRAAGPAGGESISPDMPRVRFFWFKRSLRIIQFWFKRSFCRRSQSKDPWMGPPCHTSLHSHAYNRIRRRSQKPGLLGPPYIVARGPGLDWLSAQTFDLNFCNQRQAQQEPLLKF